MEKLLILMFALTLACIGVKYYMDPRARKKTPRQRLHELSRRNLITGHGSKKKKKNPDQWGKRYYKNK